jgi:ABC-type Zn uptake system ZnuABC Zn-binding protein ZnuA
LRTSAVFSALVALLGLVLIADQAVAEDRLAVVTTTTDLKSLVQAVGGDRVAVTSLVPPNADPEEYQPRPQDITRLKEARLVVRVGLDLDLWFDRLIGRAERADLKRGRPGHIDASLDITLLDVYAQGVGPGDGHAHGSGNPHYWLDPKNAEIITAHILVRLADLDPAHATLYEANRLKFLDRLDAKLKEWEEKLGPLKGQAMIAHHNTWAYMARRFRLNFVGYVEPKPGVAPGPAYLNNLIKLIKDRDVRILVREPREAEKNLAFLAEKTGARIVLLAGSVGGAPGAEAPKSNDPAASAAPGLWSGRPAPPGVDDYLALFDFNVKALLAALEPRS